MTQEQEQAIRKYIQISPEGDFPDVTLLLFLDSYIESAEQPVSNNELFIMVEVYGLAVRLKMFETVFETLFSAAPKEGRKVLTL